MARAPILVFTIKAQATVLAQARVQGPLSAIQRVGTAVFLTRCVATLTSNLPLLPCF